MAVDRVNLIGTVFLGLTLGCAQCHSHKFDPISQREYYQFFAFFNNIDDARQERELASPEEIARRDAVRRRSRPWSKSGKPTRRPPWRAAAAWEANLDAAARARLAPSCGLRWRRRLRAHRAAEDRAPHRLPGPGPWLPTSLRDDQVAPRSGAKVPEDARGARVGRTAGRPTCSGGASSPSRVTPVSPGVPAVLPSLSGPDQKSRLDLARWLVAPNHPLTSRVFVNRVWEHYFGMGLVPTEDNFGLSGEPPSQPELLDWLAAEFIARGWSLKALHRLIVGSATYRQSSHSRPELAGVDPSNRLLARQSRLRLEAEAIRDCALSVSGLLSRKIGGPSVFPYQPDGIMKGRADRGVWVESPGADRYRRGMYTHFWRLTPHPFLRLFDAPDATAACTRRIRSNTPLQALTLLNDPTFTECARALADRLRNDVPEGDRERVRHGFRLCLGREPTADEIRKVERYLDDQRRHAPESNIPRARCGDAQLGERTRQAVAHALRVGGLCAGAAQPRRIHYQGVTRWRCHPNLLRSRRDFLGQSGLSLGSIALQALLGSRPATAAAPAGRPVGSMTPRPAHFPAQAKNVIYLFMAGGPSQLDMFDYKPVLQKLDGQPIPESFIKGKQFAQITEKQPKLLGTPYRFSRYGESGTEVSELLPYTASVVDDLAVIKTVKTTEFAHHLAELMLYTGTPRFGRPGLGAWVTYGLGSEAENLPGFVVLPGVGALGGMARTKEAVFSNGFLPSAYQGVPLRPVGEPILNVTDPPGVTRPQEQRLVRLVKELNEERLTETGDPEIAARISSYEMAFRMQASTPELLDLRGESRATLAMYGVDPDRPSFARNCLIARRLVERGVRFVQVILGDWDHHGADLPGTPLHVSRDGPAMRGAHQGPQSTWPAREHAGDLGRRART